jgi:hypothetical protein
VHILIIPQLRLVTTDPLHGEDHSNQSNTPGQPLIRPRSHSGRLPFHCLLTPLYPALPVLPSVPSIRSRSMRKTRPCQTRRQLLLLRLGNKKTLRKATRRSWAYAKPKATRDFVKLDKTKILFEGEPSHCTKIRRHPIRTHSTHNLTPSEARIRDLPSNQIVSYPNETTTALAYNSSSALTVLCNIALIGLRIELPGHVVQGLRCSTDVALRYCGKMCSVKKLPTGFLNQ